jgi:hypothetical protein
MSVEMTAAVCRLIRGMGRNADEHACLHPQVDIISICDYEMPMDALILLFLYHELNRRRAFHLRPCPQIDL